MQPRANQARLTQIAVLTGGDPEPRRAQTPSHPEGMTHEFPKGSRIPFRMSGETPKAQGRNTPVPREGWHLYQALRRLFRWLRWWMRLEARGLENLPLSGPVLVVSNHDSWLDPLALVEVMMWRARPVRFLAKSTLWKWRPLAATLDGISQIPVRRGTNDRAEIAATGGTF